MIVELVLRERPQDDFAGYEKLELPTGVIYSNLAERRTKIVVKDHHDGRVSIFTDNADVVKKIASSHDVLDIHVK
ncbi:MAG: hypothetical protein COU08_03990 [Candidatus Harrisonbacteria bacterium CG10_big_fil_rev_8_21_14_0_10_42_17]|uniref:Uncharacterized protein n=1 Tax=Candidatus Harrisonbacteria bacterium CG10_big_fil_rev_8_21_14_0_10_42_17 TaxID=1974584 RepID=A0A2M6WH74_9BACT|nr:MAG: hypothetical protein COU08_03990 [Candidatus Harrisonbacteria bacterium CG10_big_fil_rev_8_21_14_0_10_42_17]